MTTTVKDIGNAELVERIFGGWPSFHDAEIHHLSITRDCDAGPQMDVSIHHWEMTNEVDSKGYYVLRNHTLTTLRFSGVGDLQLAGFNHQNVLWDLQISELEPGSEFRFSVSMPTSYGCEASFRCREIRVLSAEPYNNHDA
jgi:hypothetical protein